MLYHWKKQLSPGNGARRGEKNPRSSAERQGGSLRVFLRRKKKKKPARWKASTQRQKKKVLEVALKASILANFWLLSGV